MNKRDFLSKLDKYMFLISFASLVISCIFSFTVENILCLIITWSIFYFSAMFSANIDSYLHYSNLDLEKSIRKFIWIAFALEITYWIFFYLIFMTLTFELAGTTVKLILASLIVVTSIVSDLFAILANDKYKHDIKIIAAIMYTIYIVVTCIRHF